MNWNDPAERAALIERVGANEYNRLMSEHIAASTIETVNGYGIRPVTSRFGNFFAVDGTGYAARSLEEARRIALRQPPKT